MRKENPFFMNGMFMSENVKILFDCANITTDDMRGRI